MLPPQEQATTCSVSVLAMLRPASAAHRQQHKGIAENLPHRYRQRQSPPAYSRTGTGFAGHATMVLFAPGAAAPAIVYFEGMRSWSQ